VSHEAFEECSSESVAVLDREPLTGLKDNDSSVSSAVRTRRRPKQLEEPALEVDLTPGVARRFRDRFPTGVSWGVSAWMLVMHVGAVAAFWYFSWGGLALLAGLHFVTACLGITLGYHRLLTHGSLIVSSAAQILLFNVRYAVGRRKPAHVGGDASQASRSLRPRRRSPFAQSRLLVVAHALVRPRRHARRARRPAEAVGPRSLQDPVQQFFHKTFAIYPVVLGILLYGIGEFCFGQGISWVLWGLCMRMVFAYHSTWFVNSATHLWGYRNYETTDRSRNLWWVALLSYGEGWHNNHHAHQRLAAHGHRWWEFDVTYMVIRLLKALGLAKRCRTESPNRAPDCPARPVRSQQPGCLLAAGLSFRAYAE